LKFDGKFFEGSGVVRCVTIISVIVTQQAKQKKAEHRLGGKKPFHHPYREPISPVATPRQRSSVIDA
jgi:hypothetical protein